MKNFIKKENLKKVIKKSKLYKKRNIIINIKSKDGKVTFEDEPRQLMLFHIIRDELMVRFDSEVIKKDMHHLEVEGVRISWETDTNITSLEEIK